MKDYYDQEGPRVEKIPQQSMTVCNGCKFLDRVGVCFGHNFREDSYGCTHPTFGTKRESLFGAKGEIIEIRTRDPYVQTPSWCPIIEEKRKG